MNIVLVGMPASGKTTVSKILGKKYGLKVVDTDEEIVKSHGPINEIFAKYGEQAFRNIEAETVKIVSLLKDVVISTGGGCLLREENTVNLKNSGKIVYLRTNLDTLLQRTKNDTERPLLKGDTKAKLSELYTRRAPVYESAADIIIDTDGISAQNIAKRIIEIVRRDEK